MPAPLAHLSFGYVIYRITQRIIPRASIPRFFFNRYVLLAAALFFSMLPDVDAAFGILFGNFGRYHNQWTHSLFFAIPPSLLVYLVLYPLKKSTALPMALLCLLGCITHVGLDYFCYGRGVMLFWPLSSQRFSSPLLLFYGVRWSDGLFSIHHLSTILNELLFALVLLPPVIFITRNPKCT